MTCDRVRGQPFDRSSGEPTSGRNHPSLLQRLVTKTLTGVLLVLVPLACASPPDPTWIPGLYDDADYDDVVGLVTDATGASSSQAPVQVEQGPVAFAPLWEPGPTPDPVLRTEVSRGPPVEARDASVNLKSNPATVPSGIFRETYWSPTRVLIYARASFRDRVSVRSSVSLLESVVCHMNPMSIAALMGKAAVLVDRVPGQPFDAPVWNTGGEGRSVRGPPVLVSPWSFVKSLTEGILPSRRSDAGDGRTRPEEVRIMRMPETIVPLLAAFVVVLFAGLAVALLTGPAMAADQWLVVNPSDFKWTPCGDAPPWDICGRVALRGDREKEAADLFYRFPKGFVFPKHWHDHPENLVVISGSMTISHDGGGEDVIGPGGYLRIPAKVAHWGKCPDGCVFYLGLVGPDSYYEVK